MGALVLSAALAALFDIGARVLRPLRRAVRRKIDTVLRLTGAGAAISLYRHVSFNLPRATTSVGVGLLLGIATIRLYVLATVTVPHYLAAYFVLVGIFAVAAATAMTLRRAPLVDAGWALGSLVAVASLLMYVASRAWGLPGLPQLVGRWDYPLGTFGIILAAGFAGLHFSVLTGMNVAYPRRQQWTD